MIPIGWKMAIPTRKPSVHIEVPGDPPTYVHRLNGADALVSREDSCLVLVSFFS